MVGSGGGGEIDPLNVLASDSPEEEGQLLALAGALAAEGSATGTVAATIGADDQRSAIKEQEQQGHTSAADVSEGRGGFVSFGGDEDLVDDMEEADDA